MVGFLDSDTLENESSRMPVFASLPAVSEWTSTDQRAIEQEEEPMEEDSDVRGGGRAAEDKRIKRQPDLADDRTTGAAEPCFTSNQLPPIQDKVRWRLRIVALRYAARKCARKQAAADVTA